MNPNVTKGANMHGLLAYLADTRGEFRDGKRNVHTNPRVIGGDAFLQARFGGDVLSRQDATAVAQYVEAPRVAHNKVPTTAVWSQDENGRRVAVMDRDEDTGLEKQRRVPQTTWHCSLSLHPDEGPLSEEQWQAISQDFMDRMGFTEAEDRSPARWVAVHHGTSKDGNDHIHIAASLVRENGARWSPPAEFKGRDWTASQQVCRELEKVHGLRLNDGAERGVAERGVKPKEQVASNQLGIPDTIRRELEHRVRAAAVASASEAEWVRRVRDDGMVIKPRFAQGTTDVAEGYRIALKTEDGLSRFHGGGKLARDLTLTRVRECWPEPSLAEADAASAEWQAAHHGRPPVRTDARESQPVTAQDPATAAKNLEGFARTLSTVPLDDHRAWQEAARDVSGALSAWAKYEKRLDPANAERLRDSARTVARSAQAQRAGSGRRQPRPQLAMGTAYLFLAATASDKPDIAAQFLAQQMMAAVKQLARYAQQQGASRQVETLRTQAFEQLQLVSSAGYASAGQWGQDGHPAARTGTSSRSVSAAQMRAAGVDEESIQARLLVDRGHGSTDAKTTGRSRPPSEPSKITRHDPEKGQDHER